jgi:hypothetical protein
MYLKEWVLSTTPRPHWEEVQSSGWIPYQPDYPWTLTKQSGTHFLGVWVADAAHNRSHLTRRAVDFASLLLPGTHISQGGMIPYLVYYPAGVDVTATLSLLSGSARMFVWYPCRLLAPDLIGPAATDPSQTIKFTTPAAGIYMFLVYGITAADFDLSITPGGGPRPILPLITPAPSATQGIYLGAAPDLSTSDLVYNPILLESGLDPLDIAIEPAGPFGPYQAFIPAVSR